LRAQAQFENLSDVELMDALCSTGDDQLLYNELVRRFHPELKQLCLNKCKLMSLDPHIGEQIAHEVFERLRRYKSFKKDNIRAQEGHAAVKSYMARCATRLFLNYFDEQKRKEELPDSYFTELRAEACATDPVRLLEIKEKTAQTFKKLTDREKAVVIADLEYKKHTKYLPDDVVSDLSKRLGVKPDTIRKLRQTAKQKLQQAFDEINEA